MAGIKSTAIRAPDDDPANHKIVLTQLKETTEIAQRLRGNPLDSFVRVREMVDSGIMRFTNGSLQPPSPQSLPPTVVPSTRKILTGGSLTGGGDISADRTHTLVNDVGSPGNLYYYGTNASGAKGFFTVASAVSPVPDVMTLGAAWAATSGAVATPTVDVARVIPYNCTLKEVIIVTRGGPGSCTIDIWKRPIGSYPPVVGDSIVGGSLPAIVAGNVYQNSTMTGWTTSFSLNDVLMFHLTVSSTFTFVSIQLRVQ